MLCFNCSTIKLQEKIVKGNNIYSKRCEVSNHVQTIVLQTNLTIRSTCFFYLKNKFYFYIVTVHKHKEVKLSKNYSIHHGKRQQKRKCPTFLTKIRNALPVD